MDRQTVAAESRECTHEDYGLWMRVQSGKDISLTNGISEEVRMGLFSEKCLISMAVQDRLKLPAGSISELHHPCRSSIIPKPRSFINVNASHTSESCSELDY